MIQKTKSELIQDWRHGDDVAVAVEMQRIVGEPFTKQAVAKWRNGQTERSKFEKFYLRAARKVQKGRVPAAVEVQ